MRIVVQCPRCETKANHRPESAGTVQRCKKCKHAYTVPEIPAAALVREPPALSCMGLITAGVIILGCGGALTVGALAWFAPKGPPRPTLSAPPTRPATRPATLPEVTGPAPTLTTAAGPTVVLPPATTAPAQPNTTAVPTAPATGQDPGAETLLNLARDLINRGKRDGAEQLLQRLLKERPNSAAAAEARRLLAPPTSPATRPAAASPSSRVAR